ncbi:OmpA family protein [Aureispira anguillae]|uniref:OmpA family protein n=1 Tax=Aureispira anguillae TaxID=2864201 RepID=A0A915VJZ8_9BACT|nr:OmpA family protein [Aureispira anguillae]BDS09442.1 OmpA family protein [Aureispira anguillae]
MLRFLLGLSIFVVWAVFARNYYICEIKGECGPPLVDVDSSFLENIPQTLDLTAGEHVILDNYPQFYFDHASHAYTYVDGNEKFLSLVATFLKEHPADSIKLWVTGYYLEDEKEAIVNSQLYNDLGIARAHTIIDKLIHEYKVAKSRIKAQSKLASDYPMLESLSFDIEGYVPPMEIAATEEDTALLEQIKTSVKNITYTDKSAKFEYNSGTFKPSRSFDVYVDSLKHYFERNPNDYLVIIGHTDSKGNAAYNQRLGLKRAKSVKAYLKEHDLVVTIKTQSKGKTSPMVEDKNPDGSYNIEAMAKNRRVNIIIKSTN